MKRIFLLLLLFSLITNLYSQEKNYFISTSDHYLILSEESQRRAETLGWKMEAALKLYNANLHLDLAGLSSPLNVRIFRDKETFNGYLQEISAETQADFVLVSFSDPRKNELVCFDAPENKFNTSLLHQGFIQYLKALAPDTPIWLRTGLAAYLENATYNPEERRFVWKANLAWLETLQKIISDEKSSHRLGIAELTSLSHEAASFRLESFYAQAWGLVHFLIQSPEKKYNRIIWDAVAALNSNTSMVNHKSFSWVPAAGLKEDFEDFILSLKTFNTLIREGKDYYSAGEYSQAATSFLGAMELDRENNKPYYYLGLIHYAQKEYDQAEKRYNTALNLGIDPALINYALGVNSFAAKRYIEAEEYLKRARDYDQAVYTEKVEPLLKRLEILK
ncbi:MAG: tetratricopeptide repeat protein [Spirochaeta sp.]|nr:tetratricopeptide repeat protein [Spirochaeta sp.]